MKARMQKMFNSYKDCKKSSGQVKVFFYLIKFSWAQFFSKISCCVGQTLTVEKSSLKSIGSLPQSA